MFFVPKVAKQVTRMFHSADITELMPEALAYDLRRNAERKEAGTQPQDKRP